MQKVYSNINLLVYAFFLYTKTNITMTITINQTRYTITTVGYGQYKISDGNITLHTTNSFIKDYIDDEDYPEKQQQAILAVDRMFSEWYEYCN